MSLDRTASEAQRQRLKEQAQDFAAKANQARTPEVRIGYLELAQRWKQVAERDDDHGELRDPSSL